MAFKQVKWDFCAQLDRIQLLSGYGLIFWIIKLMWKKKEETIQFTGQWGHWMGTCVRETVKSIWFSVSLRQNPFFLGHQKIIKNTFINRIRLQSA